MDDSLKTQVETYLAHLHNLIRRGRQLQEALATGSPEPSTIAATRAWQEDCGTTINQLSGGSKAHWLARAFSQAFLIRTTNGEAAEDSTPAEIVQRLIDVLELAVSSLSSTDLALRISTSSEPPTPHRFDFVHNAELRPILEQAFIDSHLALEQNNFDLAMRTSCGVLEAIVTDALEHKGLSALIASGAPAEKIADWSFETRLTVAERAGLIRGGCARLPAVAWTYRDVADADGENGPPEIVNERIARTTGQVLRVVMRDLDPGR